jgi:hypothetical protein
MIVSTSIVKATIHIGNSIPLHNLLEKSGKKINMTIPVYYLLFGFVSVDAIIFSVEPFNYPDVLQNMSRFHEILNHSRLYMCIPVLKVTAIGLGISAIANLTATDNGSINGNFSDWNFRFFMKTYTNVYAFGGLTYRRIEQTLDYTHFSMFITPFNFCTFFVNEIR